MKTSTRIALAALTASCLVFASLAHADEPKTSTPQKSTAPADDPSSPAYKPPLRGAPGGRVGGGTRGTPGSMFILSVLVPDHTGLTVKEQPSLFWFISGDTSLPVELTISDPNASEPLLETRIPGPVKRGIHRVRLADYGVRLIPGVAYQWSVSVIPDSARRSRDIVGSGKIERIELSSDLQSRVAGAGKEELAPRYAEAGIWYDALEAISDQIERSPGDNKSVGYRAALLRQVGLPEIAE